MTEHYCHTCDEYMPTDDAADHAAITGHAVTA